MPDSNSALKRMSFSNRLNGAARRIGKPLNNLFWRYLETRSFRNFHWVVQWEITRWCNLRCDYCCVDLVDDIPVVEDSIKTILRIKPKFLIVTGGEPLSVKNIDQVIARVKRECGDPHLVVNSNLTLSPRVVASVLPYVNVLHVSLDALGRNNGMHRDGSDGEKVLRNLEMAWKEKRDRNYRYLNFMVNCVVTKDVVSGIRDLTRTIHSISPEITLSFSGVEPHWHPMALVNHPDSLAEFQAAFAEMQKDFNVVAVGYLNNPMLNPSGSTAQEESASPPQGGNIAVECTRQYFRALVDPQGEIKACKPSLYITYHLNRARQFSQEHRYLALMKEYWDAWDTLVLHPYKRHCPFPCKCEEFLDDILARNGTPPASLSGMFNGRMREEDMDEANAFLKRQYGHELPAMVRAQWRASRGAA